MGVLSKIFHHNSKKDQSPLYRFRSFTDDIIICIPTTKPDIVYVIIKNNPGPGMLLEAVQVSVYTGIIGEEVKTVEFVPLYNSPFGDYQSWLEETNRADTPQNIMAFSIGVINAMKKDEEGKMDEYWKASHMGNEILMASYLTVRPAEGARNHTYELSKDAYDALSSVLQREYGNAACISPHMTDLKTFFTNYTDIAKILHSAIYHGEHYRIGRLDDQIFDNETEEERYAVSVGFPFRLRRMASFEEIKRQIIECFSHQFEKDDGNRIAEAFHISGMRAVYNGLCPVITVGKWANAC